VPRVGEEGERVGDEAENDLADHEEHDEHQRSGKSAAIAVLRRMRVRMPVNHLLVRSVLV